MKNTHLFHRVIIFTVEGYLEDITPETYNYPFMLKVRTAIRGYMTLRRFNREEFLEVTALSKEPFMQKLQEIQIDRTIYALELLYLYVKNIPKSQRANLNISDKKLLKAKSDLIMNMLRLKNRDTASYDRVKEIIDETRLAAKQYYNYLDTHL